MNDVEQAGIFSLRILDEVTSTNDEVRSAIDAGEGEGFAVCAHVQTAGHGRQGRIWQSPLGGLYVSCLLSPNVSVRELAPLSLVVAVSVRRALAKFISDEVLRKIKIKWPNDLLYCENNDYLKLCGISLETHSKAVCIGIGLNVFAPNRGDAEICDINTSCAYLADLATEYNEKEQQVNRSRLSLEQVRKAVLESLSDAYQMWIKQGFMPFHDEYEKCSYLTGHRVCVENIDGSLLACGSVLGVTDAGALSILSDNSDQPEAVSSGEAHIVSVF